MDRKTEVVDRKLCLPQTPVPSIPDKVLVIVFGHFTFPSVLRLKQVNKQWCRAIERMPGVGLVDVFRYLRLDTSRNIADQMRDILKCRGKFVKHMRYRYPRGFEGTIPTEQHLVSAISMMLQKSPDKLESLEIMYDHEYDVELPSLKAITNQILRVAKNLTKLQLRFPCGMAIDMNEAIDISHVTQLEYISTTMLILDPVTNLDQLEVLNLSIVMINTSTQSNLSVTLPMIKSINLANCNLNDYFDLSLSNLLEEITIRDGYKPISGFDIDSLPNLRVVTLEWTSDRTDWITFNSLASGNSTLEGIRVLDITEQSTLTNGEMYTILMKLATAPGNALTHLKISNLNYLHGIVEFGYMDNDDMRLVSELLPTIFRNQTRMNYLTLDNLMCTRERVWSRLDWRRNLLGQIKVNV